MMSCSANTLIDESTPTIRAKLVELKDFEYADPGFDYPKWKLEAANKLKNRQIEKLLA